MLYEEAFSPIVSLFIPFIHGPQYTENIFYFGSADFDELDSIELVFELSRVVSYCSLSLQINHHA